ncbi:chromate transporter [Paenibacillus pinihumi]|uniref:chromate transporter n=1 Tax=Paenibacillus pinihumi TaxID=669462 RepID=UPI00041698AE|nr:chromate transporter [Paenibacillus pinihumi]
MLLKLFWMTLKIGLMSFGGGYSMVPWIGSEVVDRYGWLTESRFTEMVSLSGLAPGPMATNIAIAVGYEQAGLTGAIVAALGMILPSFLIIAAIGVLYVKIRGSKRLQSSLYGLRSVVTGLIIYSALMLARANGMFELTGWFAWSQLIIFLGSLAALMFFRKHPVVVMIISGLVGIALYA